MNTQTLSAEVRHAGGKGSSRQLRLTGLIPAVFYGPGTEPQSLSVSPKELVKALSTEFARNVVVDLKVGGKQELAMIREVQVHPLTRQALHVDLYRVSNDRPVEVRVPLKTTGKAVGVQKGGSLNMIFKDVPISVTPDKIPASLTADVSGLDIGDALLAKDVTLPAGVTITLKPERRLATLDEYSKLVMAEDPAEAEAAAAAATTGAAAAPGAAAPAAGAKAAEKKPADKK
jgi:large subunit ribosomal protein L25